MKLQQNLGRISIKGLWRWKLTIILIILTSLSAFSQTGTSLLQKKINLQRDNVSVVQVLSAIGKQAGCTFSYSSDLLNTTEKISVQYHDISVDEALVKLLGKRLNKVQINGNQVFLQLASGEKGKIKGKVSTSDGQPAAGVTVQLNGTSYGTITDTAGYYELQAPAGNYRLTLSFTGLKTQTRYIGVIGGTAIAENFTLSESQSRLKEVVISSTKRTYAENIATVGTKLPTPIREVPNSISIIDRKLMNDLNFTTVSDAMQMVPGVTVVANGDRGQSWAAFSRGYAMPVMSDGIPSQSLFSLMDLDLSMYQQVEVLQGPAGVLQGAGEAGGVVNLVRKQALADFNWEASLSAGSWNNYRAEAGITGGLNKKKTIKGRLNFAGQTQDFFYDRTHQNLAFGYGMLEFDIDPKTILKLSGSVQGIDIMHGFTGLPAVLGKSLPRSANLNLDWQQSHPDVHEELLQFTRKLARDWKLNISGRYRGSGSFVKNGFLVGNSIKPSVIGGTITSDSALYMQNEFNKLYSYAVGTDANFTGEFKLFGRTQQLLAGFNYDRYKSKNVMGGFKLTDSVYYKHPDVPEPDYPMTSNNQSLTVQYGIYSQLRLKLADPLSILLGARTTWYSNKSKSISTDWKSNPSIKGKFTPYAGIVYDINKYLSAYVSYSDIFDPQQGYLTFAQHPLKPRTGWQAEGGLKGEFFDDKLQASLAGFYIEDRNRALKDEAHSGTSETYYIAAGIVSSRGIEAQVSGSPVPGLNLIGSYSYLKAKYDKDTKENYGKNFDFMEPRSQVKLWASYVFLHGAVKNFNIGIGANYQSKFGSYDGNYWQPAYVIFNGQIGYRFMKNYSATFTLNNMLDKKYFLTVNSFCYGTPGNFTLTIRKSL